MLLPRPVPEPGCSAVETSGFLFHCSPIPKLPIPWGARDNGMRVPRRAAPSHGRTALRPGPEVVDVMAVLEREPAESSSAPLDTGTRVRASWLFLLPFFFSVHRCLVSLGRLMEAAKTEPGWGLMVYEWKFGQGRGTYMGWCRGGIGRTKLRLQWCDC